MQRLVSVDIKASFGFLKKPDINDGMYLTYNMLHKPAVLGIFGAIAGLGGYYIVDERKKGERYVPEYLEKLGDIKIGIQPLDAPDGNFRKDVIRYTNTVGYANADGTLIVDEQTLLNPAFRVFTLLDDELDEQHQLMERLQKGEAAYVPYLGKNEHQLWWEGFREWEIKKVKEMPQFKIDSLFILPTEKLRRVTRRKSITGAPTGSFIYFERLPSGWDSNLPQYEMSEFAYTDFPVAQDNDIDNLLQVRNENHECIIHLF